MLLIIICCFFIIIFGLGLDLIVLASASASKPWPRPRSFGLGLGLEVLASFNITGNFMPPCPLRNLKYYKLKINTNHTSPNFYMRNIHNIFERVLQYLSG